MIIRICKSKKKRQTTTYFHKIVFFHEHKVSTVMDNNSININKTITNVNKKKTTTYGVGNPVPFVRNYRGLAILW
jgi:hypothetical protein